MKKMKKLLFAFLVFNMFNSFAQQWTQSGTNYYLTVGNLTIMVESAYGARISSFTRNGNEFFYTGSSIANRGTTFWPSPQSMWNYNPFPAVIDSDPYGVVLQNGDSLLVLTSGICPRTNSQVIKTICGNIADTSISVKYTLINKSGGPKSFAPWELTRVPANGLTVFPKASSWVVSSQQNTVFPPAQEDTIVWVRHQSNGGEKLFRDGGEGWIAHVHDNMILVKKFPNVSPVNFAPLESDVELWSDVSYEEVEIQGGYVTLFNNASFDWTVKWFLKSLPSNVSQSVGSPSLVKFVRDVTKSGCTWQKIGFSTLISDKKSNDPDFTINATSGSGQPVNFQIVSGPATISGNSIHLTGSAGTVTVAAQQIGDSLYCFSSANQSFNVTKSAGIDQIKQESNNVKIYPQPAVEKGFYLELNENFTGGIVEIFNIDGAEIYKQQITEKKTFIQPNTSIDKGMYILRYSNNQQVVNRKIVF